MLRTPVSYTVRQLNVPALGKANFVSLSTQRRDCARRIERLLDALATTGEHQGHRDVTILRSLPGVGRVVAATMLAEASRLLAARDYHGLRTQAGVAPVTRQSGKRLLVGMRYACNPRLRNALYYWGFISVQRDEHSRHHYQLLRGRGHSHGRALRGVVDRLLTVLMAMLAAQTPYDPARRRAALVQVP
jgi:transposase